MRQVYYCPEQRYALLADTAHALRDPGVPTPPHTAANEAAVAAVLYTFEDMIRTEVDLGDGGTDLRELLLAALGGEEGVVRPPKPTNRNWDIWDTLCRCFEARLFWDRDYAMGDCFLDLPPEAARAGLEELAIDPDYYLAVPDEPDARGLLRAEQTLARLLGRPVRDGHDSTRL